MIALRGIIDAFDEDHLDEVKPHIGGLLDQLFRLMGEVRAFPGIQSVVHTSAALQTRATWLCCCARGREAVSVCCKRLWGLSGDFSDCACRLTMKIWCSHWKRLWRSLGRTWRRMQSACVSTSHRRSHGYRQAHDSSNLDQSESDTLLSSPRTHTVVTTSQGFRAFSRRCSDSTCLPDNNCNN